MMNLFWFKFKMRGLVFLTHIQEINVIEHVIVVHVVHDLMGKHFIIGTA